jgi:hypothetical protein
MIVLRALLEPKVGMLVSIRDKPLVMATLTGRDHRSVLSLCG